MILNPDKAPTKRQTQVALEIRSIAQDFFQRESSGSSMITVTNAEVTANMRSATIYITVLPESKEVAALDFAKRMRGDLRHTIMKRLPVKVIPFIDIELDYGEKNRVRISELLHKEKEESAKNSPVKKSVRKSPAKKSLKK
jgi:ribosome-binding factor A